MKNAEIREKGLPELERMLAERREKLRKMRFDIATKQVKNHRDYRKVRNEIARMMTIIKENSK